MAEQELRLKIAHELTYWHQVAKNENNQDTETRWLVRAKQIHAIYKEAGYVQLADIITELDRNFSLAPNDNEHLRLLMSASLEEWRTGKTQKQRADEAFKQAGGK